MASSEPFEDVGLEPSAAEVPIIEHLSQHCYRDVYAPSDDTFLFLDALKADEEYIKAVKPVVVVELGSGSGAVISYVHTLLPSSSYLLAIDVNEAAARATQETAMLNNVTHLDVVRTNLFDSLTPRLLGKVDILLFNPPYVPTPTEEVGGSGISAAWAGGKNGREVIDRVLPLLSELLSIRGVAYMVVVKENKPTQIKKQLAARGLMVERLLSRRAYNEHLIILKITRTAAMCIGE